MDEIIKILNIKLPMELVYKIVYEYNFCSPSAFYIKRLISPFKKYIQTDNFLNYNHIYAGFCITDIYNSYPNKKIIIEIIPERKNKKQIYQVGFFDPKPLKNCIFKGIKYIDF